MPKATHQLRAVFLAALMIASVFAGSIVFAGASIASTDTDGGATTVDTNTTQSVATFGEDSRFRQVARGDILREPYTDMDGNDKRPYTIKFGDESTATVVIDTRSTEDGDYAGNVTLEDDGSGEAKLYVNTWEMGHSNPFEVEGATITRWDQVEYDDDDRLLNKTKSTDLSAYDLLIREGSDPAATANLFSDYAKLRIEEAETEGINMMTAPTGTEITEGADVWEEPHVFSDTPRNVSAEEDRNVSEGDTMLITPWGGGYYGPAEHAKDVTESETEALEWLVDNGHYNFTVTQTNASEDERKVLNLERAVETDAIDFVSNGTYYHLVMALDTGAPVFQHGGSGEFVAAEAGDTFSVSFAKQGRVDQELQENEDGDEFERYSPTVYEHFNVVEPTVSLDTFPDTDGETENVSGSTTLSTGTPLTVNVTAGDETQQRTTLVTEATNEEDEHLWNVTVDVSELNDDQDTVVEVSAPGFGTVTFEEDGEHECGPPEHAGQQA